MEVQIRAIETRVTDGMRDYIDGKLAKLDKMIDNVVDATLELRTEKLRGGTEQVSAQFTIRTGKHVLRSEVRESESSKAIDQAIDKLERQVRKFHDKRKSRKNRLGVADISVQVAQSAIDEDAGFEEASDRIVRTKRFTMKPMDVDEAIDQLELIGHDFFLFHNREEDVLNVLYRRRDGTYGLLGPNPV
jgi:putative sigma-54 modulation protein